jgi:hypothetical protein
MGQSMSTMTAKKMTTTNVEKATAATAIVIEPLLNKRTFKLVNLKQKYAPLTTHKKMLVEKDDETKGGSMRVSIAPEDISWDVVPKTKPYKPYENNRPVYFSATPPEWADPLNPGDIDFAKRPGSSFLHFTMEGRPINPIGRTGSSGRGLLGKWGGNQAGDPLFTSFEKNEKGELILRNDLPTLRFIGIIRKDKGGGDSEKALPGGMLNYKTLPDGTTEYECYLYGTIRELFEESFDITEDEGKAEKEYVEKLIKSDGYILFGCTDKAEKSCATDGVIDDPRNTDHAWMEGVTVAWHDKDGQIFDKLVSKLKAGDDAAKAYVMTYHPDDLDFEMYALHGEYIKQHYKNLVHII